MALKSVGASVRARLLRMAQEKNDSFEGLLVRYVHERLLYRLASEQGARFVLKGALLFPLWGPRHAFQGADLARALASTFRRRRTSVPASTPPGLSDGFAEDPTKRAQWSAFIRRLRLEADEATSSLPEVVVRIRRLLIPVADALAAGRGWKREWPAGGPWEER